MKKSFLYLFALIACFRLEADLDLSFKNEGDLEIRIATAVSAIDSSNVTVKGWMRVRPNEVKRVCYVNESSELAFVIAVGNSVYRYDFGNFSDEDKTLFNIFANAENYFQRTYKKDELGNFSEAYVFPTSLRLLYYQSDELLEKTLPLRLEPGVQPIAELQSGEDLQVEELAELDLDLDPEVTSVAEAFLTYLDERLLLEVPHEILINYAVDVAKLVHGVDKYSRADDLWIGNSDEGPRLELWRLREETAINRGEFRFDPNASEKRGHAFRIEKLITDIIHTNPPLFYLINSPFSSRMSKSRPALPEDYLERVLFPPQGWDRLLKENLVSLRDYMKTRIAEDSRISSNDESFVLNGLDDDIFILKATYWYDYTLQKNAYFWYVEKPDNWENYKNRFQDYNPELWRNNPAARIFGPVRMAPDRYKEINNLFSAKTYEVNREIAELRGDVGQSAKAAVALRNASRAAGPVSDSARGRNSDAARAQGNSRQAGNRDQARSTAFELERPVVEEVNSMVKGLDNKYVRAAEGRVSKVLQIVGEIKGRISATKNPLGDNYLRSPSVEQHLRVIREAVGPVNDFRDYYEDELIGTRGIFKMSRASGGINSKEMVLSLEDASKKIYKERKLSYDLDNYSFQNNEGLTYLVVLIADGLAAKER